MKNNSVGLRHSVIFYITILKAMKKILIKPHREEEEDKEEEHYTTTSRYKI